MRALIDANILLDVLQAREPFFKDSSLIWKFCEVRRVEGFFSALTFANLVYILRKELDEKAIEELLQQLMLIFQVADLTQTDLKTAASLHWKDFEDAVQSATAVRLRADYIVTRNVKDFMDSAVPAITPEDFLAGADRGIS
jgi:predicted nucleic acid-binding protein